MPSQQYNVTRVDCNHLANKRFGDDENFLLFCYCIALGPSSVTEESTEINYSTVLLLQMMTGVITMMMH